MREVQSHELYKGDASPLLAFDAFACHSFMHCFCMVLQLFDPAWIFLRLKSSQSCCKFFSCNHSITVGVVFLEDGMDHVEKFPWNLDFVLTLLCCFCLL